MLRPNLVSFIESEMALPTLSNKLIEKQNLNFLPLRKFENFLEFLKILQEQTKWISSRNFDEAKSVTDSINGHSSLGVSEKFPKIRFFVKITKSYRFSEKTLKWSIVTPINLSPTCHQILYSARKFCKIEFFGHSKSFSKCKWELFNEQNRNLFTNRNSVSFDSSFDESSYESLKWVTWLTYDHLHEVTWSSHVYWFTNQLVSFELMLFSFLTTASGTNYVISVT